MLAYFLFMMALFLAVTGLVSSMVPTLAQAQVNLTLLPSALTVNLGDPFTVNVVVWLAPGDSVRSIMFSTIPLIRNTTLYVPASEPLLEAVALIVTGFPYFTWLGVMVRLLTENIGLPLYCGYGAAI